MTKAATLLLCALALTATAVLILAAPEPAPPRLAVVIVVDQMRADYLSRFDSLYTHGFRRLLDHGAVFLNAYHEHAATETMPGHTTIATGRYPSHHGIIGNEFWDRKADSTVLAVRDASVKALGDSAGRGASPIRIEGPALGELLKRADPTGHVYAVALKDRAAIGLAGHRPDTAFWWSRANGNYVSSTYYLDSLPAWVDSFNAARYVDSFFTAGWQKLLPDSAYRWSTADSFPGEYNAAHSKFPHLFTERSSAPDRKYYNELYYTPFADLLTLTFARDLVHYGQLGQDSIPDLLLLSCSADDAAGHRYGPNSQEMEDYYLRLDRYLGAFFDYLDSTVGADNYVLALTGDHGVMPLPEFMQTQGIKSRRINLSQVEADMKLAGENAARVLHLKHNPIRQGGWDVVLDYTDARNEGYSEEELQDTVARELQRLPYIADTYTRAGLSYGIGIRHSYANLYQRILRADRGPDIFVRFCEYCLVTTDSTGTSHGSPYRYDTNVPIVLAGPGIASGRFADSVRTVDLAPTLAAILRIPFDTTTFDGQPLTQALKR